MKIAIIGTGISGLGCAHFLHDRHELTLYEQADYIGGHTNTITVHESSREVPIDTGFMVFNHATYPNLTRLFRELNVETMATDMSFSVQHMPTNLEYSGGSMNLLFGQRRNLFRPRHWRMLMQMDRFNREAVPALDDPQFAEMSLRDYVLQRGYGEDMLNFFLIPMGSAVWSTPPDLMADFPAMTLIRFWHNHGFLGLNLQHQWYTVVGGSKAYVKKITVPFLDRIQLGRKATAVTRADGRVQVSASDGTRETYDKVILAAHADQSLKLLTDPTDLENRLLSKFPYQANTTTLHTDASFMPKTRRCWASWNYRIDVAPGGKILPTTHYWMNMLQRVSKQQDYFVSLNCHDRIAPEKVLRRIDYEHPIFNLDAIAAQRELPALNNLSPDQTTYYAGAWFKYGFHEDGFSSAIQCVRSLTRDAIWM